VDGVDESLKGWMRVLKTSVDRMQLGLGNCIVESGRCGHEYRVLAASASRVEPGIWSHILSHTVVSDAVGDVGGMTICS
jgi:hypothetical protein